MTLAIQKRTTGIFIPKRMRDNQSAGLCMVCAKPKVEWKRRTDWACCSVECSKELSKVSRDWTSFRLEIFRRDDYRCAVCHKKFDKDPWHNYPLVADHILPIAIGGPEWDPDNLQTLCHACNKLKTRDDMALIADFRREIREQSRPKENQKTLRTLTEWA